MFVLGTVNGDIFLQYGLSKNYPGSLLVIFNCLWAVWKSLHYQKMPLILPILSTIMCFFLDGRSSLICMVLITVYCFIFRGKGWFFVMAILALGLLSYYWSDLSDLFELTSLASRGLETSRSDIWAEYFQGLDFSSFIFGLDTQNLPELSSVDGNPHNSFLSLHRSMGLLGIATYLYYLVSVFKILLRRKQYTILFMIVVLHLRMFFDGMLTTAEDFFIYTLMFLVLCSDYPQFKIKEQLQNHDNSWYARWYDKLISFV